MKSMWILGCFVLLGSCKTKSTTGQITRIVQDAEMALAHAKPDTTGQSLASLAQKMKASDINGQPEYDMEAETLFIKALLQALKQPGSFESDFAVLKEYDIHLLMADDGRFRLFYWLSPYSGTMWHVQNIIQYKTESGLVAVPFNSLYEQNEDEGAPTPFFEHIYALDSSPQTIYLLTGHGQMSGVEPYAVAHNLVWDGKDFRMDKKIFQEGNGWKAELYAQANLRDDSLSEQTAKRLRVTYDPRTKILTYPEAKASDEGYMFTGRLRSLIYRKDRFQQRD